MKVSPAGRATTAAREYPARSPVDIPLARIDRRFEWTIVTENAAFQQRSRYTCLVPGCNNEPELLQPGIDADFALRMRRSRRCEEKNAMSLNRFRTLLRNCILCTLTALLGFTLDAAQADDEAAQRAATPRYLSAGHKA